MKLKSSAGLIRMDNSIISKENKHEPCYSWKCSTLTVPFKYENSSRYIARFLMDT